MSRSRKKNPFGSITCGGDRPGRQKRYMTGEHRRLRRATREAIARGDEPPGDRLFGDPFRSPKDGKLPWYEPRGYRK